MTPRNVYFRSLLQQMFDYLHSAAGLALAQSLGGYTLAECGKLLWRGDDVQHT